MKLHTWFSLLILILENVFRSEGVLSSNHGGVRFGSAGGRFRGSGGIGRYGTSHSSVPSPNRQIKILLAPSHTRPPYRFQSSNEPLPYFPAQSTISKSLGSKPLGSPPGKKNPSVFKTSEIHSTKAYSPALTSIPKPSESKPIPAPDPKAKPSIPKLSESKLVPPSSPSRSPSLNKKPIAAKPSEIHLPKELPISFKELGISNVPPRFASVKPGNLSPPISRTIEAPGFPKASKDSESQYNGYQDKSPASNTFLSPVAQFSAQAVFPTSTFDNTVNFFSELFSNSKPEVVPPIEQQSESGFRKFIRYIG